MRAFTALAMPPRSCAIIASPVVVGELQVYLPVISVDFFPRIPSTSPLGPPALLLRTRCNVPAD